MSNNKKKKNVNIWNLVNKEENINVSSDISKKRKIILNNNQKYKNVQYKTSTVIKHQEQMNINKIKKIPELSNAYILSSNIRQRTTFRSIEYNNNFIYNLDPVIWIDSSNLTSILRDKNNNIYQILDKSSYGNHLYQNILLNQPKYHNGGILFNGNQYIKSNNSFYQSINTMSIFIVMKQYEQVNVGGIISGYSTSSTNDYNNSNAWAFTSKDISTYQYQLITNQNTLRQTNNINMTMPYGIYEIVINNGNSSLYYNGGLVANSTFSGLGNFTNLVLGARFSGSNTFDTFYKGEIYEVLVLNSAISLSNRYKVENYLIDKWKTTQFSRTIPLSNVYSWLDASSNNNFTLDSDNNVISWKDKNFNHNFSQLNINYSPKFDTNKVIFNNSYLTMVNSNNNFSVAGGNGTNKLAYSYDGINWNPSSSGNSLFSGGQVNAIAWNNNYWVAVGYNTDKSVCIAVSSDGIYWIASTNNLFSNGKGTGVAWNGSYWVAVGNNSSSSSTVSIIKSNNGMTWTASTNNPFLNSGYGIACNNSTWIAVGQTYIDGQNNPTNCIATSSNGLIWTVNNTLYSGEYTNRIAWNGSYWLATGFSTTDSCIIISKDGLNWTPALDNPFTGGNAYGVAWNGSYWVTVGNNTDNTICIATSSDGKNWTSSTNNPFNGGRGNGITWNGSRWIGVGYNSDNSTCIIMSVDGMNWNVTPNNPFTQGLSISSQIALPFDDKYNSGFNTISDVNYSIPIDPNLNTWVSTFYNGNSTTFNPINNSLASDSNGNIYVASVNGPQNIYKFNSNANITVFAGTTTSGFSGDGGQATNAQISVACGIKFDSQGNCYFIDQACLIRKINTSGVINTIAGVIQTTPQTGFNVLDGVADTVKLNTTGFPGLCIDSSDNIFFCDSTNHLIRKLYYDGSVWQIVTIAGGGGSNSPGFNDATGTAALFHYPLGICTDNNGNLYVADYHNQRIRKIVISTRVVTTIAGNSVSGHKDGYGTTATIYNEGPAAMTYHNGAVYFTELSAGQYIRRIDLATNYVQTIVNVAGVNAAGNSLNNLPGPKAGLTNPSGLVFGTNGILYFIEQGYYIRQIEFLHTQSFCAAGSQNGTMMYTEDGLIWNPITVNPLTGWIKTIVWNGSVWVAGAANGIAYSINGIYWVLSNVTSGCNQIIWNENMWYAVTSAGLKNSQDGITWTNNSFNLGSINVIGANESIILIFYNDSDIAYSTDGITWTNATNGSTPTNSIILSWNGIMWITGSNPNDGTGSPLKYSYNGFNWLSTSSPNYGYDSIGCNNNMWVAHGYLNNGSGSMMYSYDGINWSNSTSDFGNGAVYTISWNGSLWIVGGTYNYNSGTPSILATSPNGINWTNNTSGKAIITGLIGSICSQNVLPYKQIGLNLNNFSIFYVFDEITHNDNAGLLSCINTIGNTDSSVTNGFALTTPASKKIQLTIDSENLNYTDATSLSKKLYEFNINNSEGTLYINGVEQLTASFGPLGSGLLFAIGARQNTSIFNTSNPLNANIYELLILKKSATYAQRSQIYSYLCEKWNISSILSTPAPNPTIWLDSNSSSVTVDGSNNITAWPDLSSNNYPVTINNTKPVQSTINGLKYASFSGSDVSVTFPSNLTGNNSTLYIVCSATEYSGANRLISFNNGTTESDSDALNICTIDLGQYLIQNGASINNIYTTVPFNNNLFILSITNTNNTWNIYINNYLSNTFSSQNYNYANLRIGNGNYPSMNASYTGYINEVLFYNTALDSDSNIGTINYLANKWKINIQSSLINEYLQRPPITTDNTLLLNKIFTNSNNNINITNFVNQTSDINIDIPVPITATQPNQLNIMTPDPIYLTTVDSNIYYNVNSTIQNCVITLPTLTFDNNFFYFKNIGIYTITVVGPYNLYVNIEPGSFKYFTNFSGVYTVGSSFLGYTFTLSSYNSESATVYLGGFSPNLNYITYLYISDSSGFIVETGNIYYGDTYQADFTLGVSTGTYTLTFKDIRQIGGGTPIINYTLPDPVIIGTPSAVLNHYNNGSSTYAVTLSYWSGIYSAIGSLDVWSSTSSDYSNSSYLVTTSAISNSKTTFTNTFTPGYYWLSLKNTDPVVDIQITEPIVVNNFSFNLTYTTHVNSNSIILGGWSDIFTDNIALLYINAYTTSDFSDTPTTFLQISTSNIIDTSGTYTLPFTYSLDIARYYYLTVSDSSDFSGVFNIKVANHISPLIITGTVNNTSGLLNHNNIFTITLSNNENYDLSTYLTNWDIFYSTNNLSQNGTFITSAPINTNQQITFSFNPGSSNITIYFYVGNTNMFSSPIRWEPNNVYGLQMWLDSSLNSNFIFSSGNTISVWKDSSGNNNTATAVGGVTLTNNKVTFNGSTGYFTTPYTAHSSTESVFVVYSTNNTNLSLQSLVDSSAEGGRQFGNVSSPSGPSLANNSIAWKLYGNYSIASGTTYIAECVYNTTGINIYVSGNPSANNSTNLALTAGTTTIGAGYYITVSGITWFLNGTISEVIIYNKGLTSFERQVVEGYLAWKWLLNSSLPISHPFYNEPPPPNQLTSWEPTSIYGLQVWFDALNPLLNNSHPNDGSTINIWADKSGNIANAISSSGTTIIKNNIQNGLPVIRMDGDQLLNCVLPSRCSSYTIFTVQKCAGNTGYMRLLNGISDLQVDSVLFYGLNGNTNLRISTDWTQLNQNTPTYDTTSWGVLSSTFTGSTNQTYVNGSAEDPITTNSAILPLSEITIGGLDGQNWNGDIGEIIVYNGVLSTSERQTVEGYLAWKWGLQSNLPSNHPYFSNSPIPYIPKNFSIAYGEGSNKLNFSYDGKIWYPFNCPLISINALQWNGSIWVMVGENGDRTISIAISADGINWKPSTNNPFSGGVGYGIGWNGSYWVAGAYDGQIATSPDGFNWTVTGSISGRAGVSIAWNGYYWLLSVFSVFSGGIYKSYDAITWTNTTNSISDIYFSTIAWNGAYWVLAIGKADGSYYNSLYKSYDGENWIQSTTNPLSAGQAAGVAWNGSYWLTRDSNAGAGVGFAKSYDGLEWTITSSDPFTYGAGGDMFNFCWNGSLWIATGRNADSSVTIVTSPDAVTWTRTPTNPYSGNNNFGHLVASRIPQYIPNQYNFSLVPTTSYPYIGSAFTSVASSSNGQKLVSCAKSSGSIWTSTDGGVTWIERTSAGSRNWISVASSSNGTKLIAADQGGSIWTSSNSGVTWTERPDVGPSPQTWSAVAISANGTYALASAGVPGVSSDYVYLSSNSGATWTQTGSSQRNDWTSLTISDNGATLYATNSGQYYGPIQKSTNSGATWSAIPYSNKGTAFYCIASSSDGTKLITGDGSNGIGSGVWTSTNTGLTWTNNTSYLQSQVIGFTGSVVSSNDGVNLAVVANNSVWTSQNSGDTWTQETTPTGANLQIACDAPGTTLYAVGDGDGSTGMYLWKGVYTTSWSWTQILISADLSDNTVSVFGCIACSKNGQYVYVAITNLSIWKSSDYGANWSVISGSPTINYTGNAGVTCSDNGSIVMVFQGIVNVSSNYGVDWNANAPYLGALCGVVRTTKLVVGWDSTGIYVSTDGGDTWTLKPGSQSSELVWRGLTMSLDDSIIVASGNQQIIVSSDSGDTWYTHPNRGSWKIIRVSSDFTKLIAANTIIYLSIDSGVSWKMLLNAGTRSWTSITVSTDFTKIAATVNGGYIYYSTNSGDTWSQGAYTGTQLWTSISGDSTGQYLTSVVDNGSIWFSQNYGASWYTYTNLGSVSWLGSAISSDATTMVVGNGVPWISNNGGINWREVPIFSPGTVNTFSSFISSDGTFIAIAVNGTSAQHIWTSSDSGYTWTEQTASGQREWTGISGSSNGEKLSAVTNNNNIWVSADYGVTWTSVASVKLWKGIASSSDGTKLAACVTGPGSIWTSSNSGTTWTEQTAAGSRSWASIASNSTGQYIVSVDTGGYIWTSADSGSTWTQQTGSGEQNWSSVGCSTNGRNIVAGINNGSIWTSNDFGVTWYEQGETYSGNWYSVAISGNGHKIIAAHNTDVEILLGTAN